MFVSQSKSVTELVKRCGLPSSSAEARISNVGQVHRSIAWAGGTAKGLPSYHGMIETRLESDFDLCFRTIHLDKLDSSTFLASPFIGPNQNLAPNFEGII